MVMKRSPKLVRLSALLQIPKRPGSGETAVTRLEHSFAVERDGEIIVDGLDP